MADDQWLWAADPDELLPQDDSRLSAQDGGAGPVAPEALPATSLETLAGLQSLEELRELLRRESPMWPIGWRAGTFGFPNDREGKAAHALESLLGLSCQINQISCHLAQGNLALVAAGPKLSLSNVHA
eukprot:jgi/Mesen1/10156/ME000076S09667